MASGTRPHGPEVLTGDTLLHVPGTDLSASHKLGHLMDSSRPLVPERGPETGSSSLAVEKLARGRARLGHGRPCL